MRPTFLAFLLTLSALAATRPATAEPDMDTVRCTAIRDAAQCVSRPDCWYDAAGGNGCLKGPRPDENPCQVHGSKSVCNTSTLGCTWNEAESKCVRKAN